MSSRLGIEPKFFKFGISVGYILYFHFHRWREAVRKEQTRAQIPQESTWISGLTWNNKGKIKCQGKPSTGRNVNVWPEEKEVLVEAAGSSMRSSAEHCSTLQGSSGQ